ncbi:hypothetical protein AB0F17_16150 [Nonomuraea sp. NPDC026600]|uniref:hypothetical protein n=1 Tax=Nonomuraea sp. NPDC026600 TaxID=3155363 RepID=UPI0033C4BC07
MARSATKELNKQLRQLRKEWREWRSGQAIRALGWWGTPWCEAGRRGRCRETTCEGCATVAFTQARTAEIEAKVRDLMAESATTPPVQEALFA